MAANIQFEDDANDAFTSFSFGTVDGGDYAAYKFYASNIGDTDATGVLVGVERASGNDGVDFALLALDDNGNPGTYGPSDLSLGTIAAGDVVAFWVKVTVPSNTSPAGNPRQFTLSAEYAGV